MWRVAIREMFRDSQTSYGGISILLHWASAVAIVGLFGLGVYMVELTYYDPLYNRLPQLHKSIGLLHALVFALGIAWRLANPWPAPVAGIGAIEARVARGAKHVFYWLIAIVIVSGYLIPTAGGAPISLFGWIDVPALIADLPRQEDVAGLVHRYAAYLLIALASLHAAAALKHHWIDRDATLRRMLGRRETEARNSN